jgi:hypothetical protein
MSPSMFRRTAISLSVFAAVGVCAGCGGGRRPVSRPTALNESAAVVAVYAKSVNLKAGDLPGMTPISVEGEIATNAFSDEVTQCGGSLPVFEADGIGSATFQRTRDLESVMSVVHHMSSPAIAERNVAANLKPGVRACFANVLRSHYPRGPLVANRVAVSLLPSHMLSVPSGFGMRITVQIIYKHAVSRKSISPNRNYRITQEVLGFTSGSSVVALIVGHASRQLVPDSSRNLVPPAEQRLLLLLYSRTKVRKL